MNDMKSHGERDEMTHVGLTRRTMVRTAGKAAWVAPVIVVATAAPAVAASQPAITTGAISAPRSGNTVTVSVPFTNSGGSAPTTMTVAVTVTPTLGGVDAADPTGVSANFSFTGRTGSGGGGQVFSFSKNAPQIAGGGGAATLTFSFGVTNAGGQRVGVINVQPTANPGSEVGNPAGAYT